MRGLDASGSLRVTMTSGFLAFGIVSALSLRLDSRIVRPLSARRSGPVNRAAIRTLARLASVQAQIRASSCRMAWQDNVLFGHSAGVMRVRSLAASLAALLLAGWRGNAGLAAPRPARPPGGERPAAAALRQPQGRPGQCARAARQGPECAGCITRAGLPVEITAEFENWRRIRDSEGAEGWVYHRCCRASAPPWWRHGRRRAASRSREADAQGRQVVAKLQSRRHRRDHESCTGNWCELTARATTAGSSGRAVGRLSEREDRVT